MPECLCLSRSTTGSGMFWNHLFCSSWFFNFKETMRLKAGVWGELGCCGDSYRFWLGDLGGHGILSAGTTAGTSLVRAAMCRVTVGCSGSLLCHHLFAEV